MELVTNNISCDFCIQQGQGSGITEKGGRIRKMMKLFDLDRPRDKRNGCKNKKMPRIKVAGDRGVIWKQQCFTTLMAL